MYRLKSWMLFAIIVLSCVFIFPTEQTTAQSADEQSVLTLINQERALLGLSPFIWDSCLASGATRHSNDMSTNGFLSHTGSDGSSLRDRLTDAGYPTSTAIGENIASGYTTPITVVAGWMASTGHRDNILSTNFAYVGISRVNNYWTNTFGSAPCGSGSTTGSSTGGTTTGSSTGGTTTGSSTGGTTTGSSTGGTTTGSSTGGTTTGSSTGGGTTGSSSGGGTTSTSGSGTAPTTTTSTSGNGTAPSSNNQSTQTTTSSNLVDECSISGGSIQVSFVTGMNCTTLSPSGVGNQSVLNQGFVNGVDIWGNFAGSVEVCLLGSGSLIFMDAAGAPRIPQPISISAIKNGMTCTNIATAGSVILVGSANQTAPTTVTTSTTNTTTTSNPPIINANGSIIHTVQAGENLFRIGLRYGIPYQQLAPINGIGADYRIYVGQQLIIPQ